MLLKGILEDPVPELIRYVLGSFTIPVTTLGITA